MAAHPSPDFDPRFPRAFQPGYADSDQAAAEAANAEDLAVGPEQRAEIRPPSVSIPEAALPGAEDTTADGSSLSVNGPRDTEPPSAEAADADEDIPVRRSSPLRNPFLIGLILLAVAFAAGGLWFANLVSTAYSGGVNMGTEQMVLMQMASIIAPVLLSGSVLTTVAILFHFAVRWSPDEQ